MLIESTGLIGTVDEVTGGKFTTACGYLPSGTGEALGSQRRQRSQHHDECLRSRSDAA